MGSHSLPLSVRRQANAGSSTLFASVAPHEQKCYGKSFINKISKLASASRRHCRRRFHAEWVCETGGRLKTKDEGSKAHHYFVAFTVRPKSCPDASCNLNGIFQVILYLIFRPTK